MSSSKGISFIQIICALLIVNYHTNTLDIPLLNSFAKLGFVMNTVFVFMSGYLLSKSFSKNPNEPIRDFLLRRVKRIYPAFHVSLLLIVLLSIVYLNSISAAGILSGVTGFGYFLPHNELFANTHLWFVTVILSCYLLFIPTYKLTAKNAFLPLTVFSILILSSFYLYGTLSGLYERISGLHWFRFIYHYVVFCIGIYLQKYGTEPNKYINYLVCIVGAIGYTVFVKDERYSYLAVISAIITAVSLTGALSTVSSFFEKRLKVLFLLAPVTFELYLIHYPIIQTIDIYLHGSTVAYFLTFILSIPAAFLVRLFAKRYLSALNSFLTIGKPLYKIIPVLNRKNPK